jgi:hypothetical protein
LRRDSGARETMLVEVIAVIVVTRANIRGTRDMKNVRKDKPITLEMKDRGEKNQHIGSKNRVKTRVEGHSHNQSHRNTKNLRGAKIEWKIGSLKERMRANKRK